MEPSKSKLGCRQWILLHVSGITWENIFHVSGIVVNRLDRHSNTVSWRLKLEKLHVFVMVRNSAGRWRLTGKVKSCYNLLRLGTAIVLVSSGIDFVNRLLHVCIATEPPTEKDCQFGLMVCARGSPKCLDFTRNTLQLNQLCPRCLNQLS